MDNKSIQIDIEIIDNILRYCENQAIYDKLGDYGDFYYKLINLKHTFNSN